MHGHVFSNTYVMELIVLLHESWTPTFSTVPRWRQHCRTLRMSATVEWEIHETSESNCSCSSNTHGRSMHSWLAGCRTKTRVDRVCDELRLAVVTRHMTRDGEMVIFLCSLQKRFDRSIAECTSSFLLCEIMSRWQIDAEPQCPLYKDIHYRLVRVAMLHDFDESLEKGFYEQSSPRCGRWQLPETLR